MTNQPPVRVYFGCLFCGALHSAIQTKRPVVGNGRFDCKECRQTLHRWWGVYDFTDWKGPLKA
jgi:transcription elongation factor Elf1